MRRTKEELTGGTIYSLGILEPTRSSKSVKGWGNLASAEILYFEIERVMIGNE
jgi:hypothetical protein